ncbi:MAG: Fe-S protein assembly co-chaperone HscB [Pseudomonadota bacterium]
MNSSHNFFSLFDLPLSSEVDKELLEQKYKQLQVQLHPDRHVNSDGSSKLAAIQQASMINDAYATLKSPLRRAEHLLQVKGIDTSVYDQSELDKGFLLAQLRLREELEELQQQAEPQALEALQQRVEKQLANIWSGFSAQISSGNYPAAYLTFRELQFLHKLIDEIREAEDKLLDY